MAGRIYDEGGGKVKGRVGGVDRWEETPQMNIDMKRTDDRNVKIKRYI